VTSTLCAVKFSKSYVKCRLHYVMLRFVVIPFFLIEGYGPGLKFFSMEVDNCVQVIFGNNLC
jgi:hypothetical protein